MSDTSQAEPSQAQTSQAQTSQVQTSQVQASPAQPKHHGRIVSGFHFEDLPLGTTWESPGRTLLEGDLGTYVNLTWFTEDLFTDQHEREGNAIAGRPVPAIMVMAFAEGLIVPSMERTGLAFLNVDMDVKAPMRLGDTVHVHCEVIESRPTSKPGRGLVRTRNTVRNQHGDTVLVYRPLRLVRCRDAPPVTGV
ncbi:MAG: acyl dehydratase [Rhizobacter sp.]|nr:acyl dehydratase [Rhizobacter sp.]